MKKLKFKVLRFVGTLSRAINSKAVKKLIDIGYLDKQQHEARYRDLLKNLKEEKVFVKEEKVLWKCMNCGHKHEGIKALEMCPVCVHPKAHFKIAIKEY